MIIDLELNDDIYNSLETSALEIGITVKELLRWIIGEWVRFSHGPRVLGPIPVPLSPVASETESLLKISRVFIKGMIKQGGIKCSNCTMPLTMEDIEAGKCSKCESEI